MKYDFSLYYVLDLPTGGRDPLDLAGAATAGGASVIQLRGKEASAREMFELAVAIKRLVQPLGVPLIINDRLDVALAAQADGVHVGADDLPFDIVRYLAHDMIVGVSCYDNIQLAHEALEAGADYVAFGSFYPSPTKRDTIRTPLSVLTEARDLGVPIVAIGGITRDHVPELMRAGASGVAVVSAIQSADDPEQAARALRVTIDEHRV